MAAHRLLKACLILAIIGWASPAWAHDYPCNTRAAVEKLLGGKYKETWQAVGETNSASVRYELWINKTDQSWTFVITIRDGLMSCLIAGGTRWKWAGGKAGE